MESGLRRLEAESWKAEDKEMLDFISGDQPE